MVSYFFSWTPMVIVFGTLVLLTNPYLALIAFMIVSLVTLAALAWAIVALPYMLGGAISRRWPGHDVASPRDDGLVADRASQREARSAGAEREKFDERL